MARQPEREDSNQTQTEHCQETTMRDGNVRVQGIVNETDGTHTLEDTRAATDDALPTIHTRTSPAIFVKAVSGLSEDQKRAVRDMGFGCLLDLKITATPAKMGYWLVDNFNHMDRKLQLYDGGKIHVKENDVYSVMGLPRGTIEVANRKKKTESGVLKEWADIYNVSVATKITATKVLEMIQTCDRSDDWFKRHFVVLMITCLFESSQNGVANLRTVHLLDDLSNVNKMNWCAYLIRCLVGAKKSWNASQKRKIFTGPLLFLTLFYVDKVVLSIRTVERSLPTFKSWNNGLLKARERDEIAAADRDGVVNEPVADTVPDCVQADRDGVVNEPVADTVPDCVQGVSGDVIADNPIVDAGRPKRSPKFSSLVKSPFQQRYIDVVRNLDSQEKAVVNWSLSLDYAVKRDVVACLAPNTPIPEALIDLWARIMNSNENLGSRGSVACFFATTRPCNEYVFPVHSGGFSGLICISPGNQKLYILDSAGFCKDASIKKSVSSHASILRQSLAQYMGHPSRCRRRNNASHGDIQRTCYATLESGREES
ncbi:Unknown protein [Striga hermonthica]|uniref:Uncharacterized protein n=1 Tax=Striga hermonthica TaxID=68872 RepID=A0A9N7R7S3_STRHE|nr:Unknown protein [Striga hermonthica]